MSKATEITENGHLYTVYYDFFPEIGKDFDYGDDTANQEYLQKFIDEEIFSFYITKSKKCECCDQWKIIDSLGGIHAMGIEDAMTVFKENIGE